MCSDAHSITLNMNKNVVKTVRCFARLSRSGVEGGRGIIIKKGKKKNSKYMFRICLIQVLCNRSTIIIFAQGVSLITNKLKLCVIVYSNYHKQKNCFQIIVFN